MKQVPALFLTLFGNQISIREILHSADVFVNRLSVKYNIDESHNHIHSRYVLHYAKEILLRRPRISKNDVLITSLGSFLHDVIDPKYIPENQTKIILDQAYKFIIPDYKGENLSPVLSELMPWTSFSKTVTNSSGHLSFHLPEHLKDHPHLESYHTIRQADLLTSYNIKRTLQYRLHKSGYTKSRSEILSETESLFQNRMWKLLSSDPSVFHDTWVRDEIAFPLHLQSKSLMESCPENISNSEDLLCYFNMDPLVTFTETLDDIEDLYEQAEAD